MVINKCRQPRPAVRKEPPMKKLSDLIGLRTIKTAAAIIIALAIVNLIRNAAG